MLARITALYTYPIKSCASIALPESPCGYSGLKYDREWVIVDNRGQVVTQRDCARMALIQPGIGLNGQLTLQGPQVAPLTVPTGSPDGQRVPVEVWGDPCVGFDQGPEASSWLSDFLGTSCKLLRHDPTCVRHTKKAKPDGTKGEIAFADACPLLIISQESLEHLNQRLSEPVPMSRFRPSIIVSGLGEFAEDHVKTLSTSNMTLHSIKPCARCVIVTIDQEQAVPRGPEPLRTLNQFRRQGDKVLFGQYFMPDKPGTLRVGDALRA